MAKTKRVKKVLEKVLTSDQVEKVMGEYSEMDNQLENIVNKMEAEIVQVRKKYETNIQNLKEEMEISYERLMLFAESNRTEEFDAKGRKTMSTVHGELGFRMGQLKVSQMRGYKVAESLSKLKEYELDGYIRKTEAIDKQHIIETCKDEEKRKELAASLKLCGLKIDQEESFFVTIKKEELQEA